MSKMGSPSYNRAPSPELRKLLAPGGFLAPFLSNTTVDGIGVEIQLRSKSEVHLYCGLTCLLMVKSSKGGKVWIESRKSLACQKCARLLFRPGWTREVKQQTYLRDVWTVFEPGIARALDTFLSGVQVDQSQIKEGGIQARWSRILDPWIAFDKEAALAYPSIDDRRRQLSEAFRLSVDEARSKLSALAQSRRSSPNKREHWQMPPKQKVSLKLDQLAIDTAGNLVLLEIKDASGTAAEVYYAPFQILQNVWEWHYALHAVRSSLQELLDARVEFGLVPGNVPPINGGIRAAVGFGKDDRSDEVKSRYAKVLCIANQYLPTGVSPIETWCLAREKPVCLT